MFIILSFSATYILRVKTRSKNLLFLNQLRYKFQKKIIKNLFLKGRTLLLQPLLERHDIHSIELIERKSNGIKYVKLQNCFCKKRNSRT